MRRSLAITAVAVVLSSATSLRAADLFVDTLDLTKVHQATGDKPTGTVNGKKPDHALTVSPPGSLVIDTKSAVQLLLVPF